MNEMIMSSQVNGPVPGYVNDKQHYTNSHVKNDKRISLHNHFITTPTTGEHELSFDDNNNGRTNQNNNSHLLKTKYQDYYHNNLRGNSNSIYYQQQHLATPSNIQSNMHELLTYHPQRANRHPNPSNKRTSRFDPFNRIVHDVDGSLIERTHKPNIGDYVHIKSFLSSTASKKNVKHPLKWKSNADPSKPRFYGNHNQMLDGSIHFTGPQTSTNHAKMPQPGDYQNNPNFKNYF